MSHLCELTIQEVIRGQNLGKLLNLPTSAQFSCKHLKQLMSPVYTNHSVHIPTFVEQR